KDLVVKSAAAAGKPITITPRGDDLLELRSEFEPGSVQLDIEYTGKLDTLNTTGAFKQNYNGAGYVYTQLEALYARRVFPCIDEPDSKVPWQLTLDVPAGVTAVSNTPLAETAVLPTGGTRYEFHPSQPLPSYLVAFGVG